MIIQNLIDFLIFLITGAIPLTSNATLGFFCYGNYVKFVTDISKTDYKSFDCIIPFSHKLELSILKELYAPYSRYTLLLGI